MATPHIFTPSPGEAIEPEIRTDLGTPVLFVNNEGDMLDFILGGRCRRQRLCGPRQDA
jgi:hypothetical protein